MSGKIPVYVITGFLGSGKTTLLLKLIEHAKANGQNPGVVLNELGEVNVERALFLGGPLIEMLNGCICCTIQEDLQKELVSFLASKDEQAIPIDVIYIEGTGIANPGEMIEALTHPALIDKLELKSIISLMDASQFLEYQSIFSSSKEIRTVLKQQVTNSTLLIVNKIDLINERKRSKVINKIEEWKLPGSMVYETSFSDIPVDIALQERVNTAARSVHRNVGHHHHHHPHEFQAVKLEDIPVLDKDAFRVWLKQLPATMIRAKGVIPLAENHLCQFQYASQQLKIGERETLLQPCIILIGAKLNAEEITQSFRERFIGYK